eukprot:1674906-Amphidinium_carterae.2
MQPSPGHHQREREELKTEQLRRRASSPPRRATQHRSIPTTNYDPKILRSPPKHTFGGAVCSMRLFAEKCGSNETQKGEDPTSEKHE